MLMAVLSSLAGAIVSTAGPVMARPPDFMGEAAPFTSFDQPTDAPSIPISDLNGAASSLERFRGKVVLLNFWATWCAPCVHELPTLDGLQAELGGETFTVIAVTVDRGGSAVVRSFLARDGLSHLPVYLDAQGKLASALGSVGLPVTYVVGKGGQLEGSLVRPADWASEPARALIRYYIAERMGRSTPTPPAGFFMADR